jgi:hypothetical protein
MKKLITFLILSLFISQLYAVDIPLNDGTLKIKASGWTWTDLCKSNRFSCFQAESQEMMVSLSSFPLNSEAFKSTCAGENKKKLKNKNGISYCEWKEDNNVVILLTTKKNVISLALGMSDKNKNLNTSLASELINSIEYLKEKK